VRFVSWCRLAFSKKIKPRSFLLDRLLKYETPADNGELASVMAAVGSDADDGDGLPPLVGRGHVTFFV
jgi:hypothetical protein